MNLRAMVEALIFASRGITLKKLSHLLKVKEEELLQIIEEIEKDYLKEEHGVELKKLNDVYRFYTKPEYAQFVVNATSLRTVKLTSNQLEIVAAIVLNGPLTIAAINEIRGKESSHLVRSLHKAGVLTRRRKAGKYLYDLSRSFRDMIAIENVLGHEAEHTITPSS
ncbi:MAG: SMC-Scp complex subunit ScpB [Pseudothermotoga sp.]|uniref:SMC-Scp complex subunit ScpB n=1 Tax=Pseudothermotoga hypogea TaxID=57487 RepID=A0A832I5Y9_9THEM|nr:SMC-Scp complex subunit ScpB [Pseudothermotoga sp.]MBC7122713.1 SMC-Scp complex subunit ScpB [Pseudothermotoga sp.]MDI6862107.1 SMC-Scp complex subunit ScpB [Pseudothermotoga sp.]